MEPSCLLCDTTVVCVPASVQGVLMGPLMVSIAGVVIDRLVEGRK